MDEINSLKTLLQQAQHIVICAHKSPDGDAVGSTLAWKHYLEQTGKTDVRACLPDAAPDFLQWLPGFQTIIRYDKRKEEVEAAFAQADLVCCLDFNSTSRVEAMQAVLDSAAAPRVLIDHHLEPDIDCRISFSHPEMSSTSEIIFHLIDRLGGFDAMSTQCAQCIYCGMMTDTGGFTYNSTRPEIYSTISRLLTKGIDKDKIYNRVYHNYSVHALRLRAHIILNKLRVVEELHAAYYTVTKREMHQFHFVKGDMEGLVNVPQQIKGLKLSISLREDTENPNRILVSLRSCNGFRCQPMAVRFFNGGGHANAAGGKLSCNMAEAEQITLHAIMAFREELK